MAIGPLASTSLVSDNLKRKIHEAFDDDIARAIEDHLEKTMSACGFGQTLILDIEPDNHVKKVKDEINADADSSCGSNGNLYPVFSNSPSRYPHVKYHGNCRTIKAGSQDVRLEHEALDDLLKAEHHYTPWDLGHKLAGGVSHCLQQDVRCETKTKDNVFVNVVASVEFGLMEEIAVNAFCNLSNTREKIQTNVFDVIRASVPKLNLDAAFEQKNDIARAIKDQLEKAMSACGFEIVQTLIVDIELDNHVKKVKEEINADADSSCGSNGNLYPAFSDSPSRYPHVKYHGNRRKIKAGSQDVRLEHENAMLKKQLKQEKSKSKAFLERLISLERKKKHRS